MAGALALNRCPIGLLFKAGTDRRTDLGITPRCLGVFRGSLQDHQFIQCGYDSHNFFSNASGTVTGTSPPINLIATTTSPRSFLLGVTTIAFLSQNGPAVMKTGSPATTVNGTGRSASYAPDLAKALNLLTSASVIRIGFSHPPRTDIASETP